MMQRGKPMSLIGVILLAILATCASAGIPDGKKCYVKAPLDPVEACDGGIGMCVVNKVPSLGSNGLYEGICNSSYASGPACVFASQPYAVGTTNVPGNSLCPASCTCKVVHSTTQAGNFGSCECPAPGTLAAGAAPTKCQTDIKGAYANGSSCPSTEMCLITNVGGGGTDKVGNPIDTGVCWSSQQVYSLSGKTCTSAGARWAMKWYAQGTNNVPLMGNWCMRCACTSKGLRKCATTSKCTQPRKG